MDINNKYETVNTHNLVRMEYSVLLIVMAGIAALNYESINWYLFNALFWGLTSFDFILVWFTTSISTIMYPKYFTLYTTHHIVI